MESYLLKFYRRGDDDREPLYGLLECTLSGEKAVFQSFSELHGLLLCGLQRGSGRKKGHVAFK